MVEMSFIKTKSEDFCGGNLTSFIEMKFKILTMTRSIGVHEGFCFSERNKYGFQGFYLFS